MRWYFPYWLRSYPDSQEQEQQELAQRVQALLLRHHWRQGQRVLPHQRRVFLRALHRRREQREQQPLQQQPQEDYQLGLPLE